MGALRHWLMFSVPLVTMLGLWRGGGWSSAAVVAVFVALPCGEALLGRRGAEPEAEAEAETEAGDRRWFDLPLWAWGPVHLLALGYGLHQIAHGQLSGAEVILAALSVGVMAGSGGIVVAHEFAHRPGTMPQIAAEVLMASVTYTHFCVEHVAGHHRNVATSRDPASATRGESVYRFMIRSATGGLRSALAIEGARAARRGIPWWSPRQRMTRYLVTQVVLYAGIHTFAGGAGVAYWLGQSIVAVTLLEVINYVEHYGLRRRTLPSGRYERVQPWHSWNADHRLTNWCLFNLQLHSDHHHLASRHYHQLRSHADVPQLPAGYATMFLVALIPPLWRKLMDARVDQWSEPDRVPAPGPISAGPGHLAQKFPAKIA